MAQLPGRMPIATHGSIAPESDDRPRPPPAPLACTPAGAACQCGLSYHDPGATIVHSHGPAGRMAI